MQVIPLSSQWGPLGCIVCQRTPLGVYIGEGVGVLQDTAIVMFCDIMLSHCLVWAGSLYTTELNTWGYLVRRRLDRCWANVTTIGSGWSSCWDILIYWGPDQVKASVTTAGVLNLTFTDEDGMCHIRRIKCVHCRYQVPNSGMVEAEAGLIGSIILFKSW